mgnify:CR=1 FL=1|tara:strand:- start:531 stop:959 length:429 start_codon:yes stop_codon:yes gene_type:complete
MSDKNFPEVIKEIHQKDDRFGKGAYYFVREALDHTLKSMEKDRSLNKGHVSGRELLEGIRDYALDRFGPMTMTLMHHWNVKKCRDFGDIVFNLVDHGILGQTENDSLDDFEGGYSFKEAFENPFLPDAGTGSKSDSDSCKLN